MLFLHHSDGNVLVSMRQNLNLMRTACADSSGSDPTTIFVKGFDKYQGEEDVRQALTEVFQDCGEIASVRLPTDRETQELKGIAFIQFAAPEGKVLLLLHLTELG